MIESDFRLQAKDGTALFVREWLPPQKARAVVQIAHGMAEHSARYARLAQALTDQGYAVYADDHRGHGKTAPSPADLGHFADENSWELAVGDQLSIADEIKSRHPGVPVVLMGHSMGSYLARSAILRRPAGWLALVLSGTSHSQPIVQHINRIVPSIERLWLGKRGKSPTVRKFSFDAFNAKFRPNRTGFDWLSRDEAEVDKYVADPLCGFDCSIQLWLDMFVGLAEIYSQAAINSMPSTLPVYVMAGERDPLNVGLKDIRALHQAFEKAGLRNVTVRCYPEARHELLNELNRDEITRELLAWLGQQLTQ